jgi:hypothetical protein
MIEQFLKPFKVEGIEALPDGSGVEVTFRTPGRDPIKFRTKKMGLKNRAKRAALAKFASACGMGTAEDLFHFFRFLGPEFVGDVCPDEPLGGITADRDETPQTLRVIAVEEAA